MIRKFFIACLIFLGGLSSLLAATPDHNSISNLLQNTSVEVDLSLLPDQPETLLNSVPYEQPKENFNTEKASAEEEENLDEDPEPDSGKKQLKSFKDFVDVYTAQSHAHLFSDRYTSAERWIGHCPRTISKRYLFIEVIRI